MTTLKIGAVGTGGIFRHAHGPGWAAAPEAELVALCDPHLASAEAMAAEYGVTKVYADYREMLEKEQLDAIGICTPNLYHSEIAIAALEKGLHVFCEKPDAINPLEAQRMADAAERSGKILMTMRNNRFMPSSKFLKSFIESGKMGEIYTGRTGWVRRRGIPGLGGWFTNKELAGGGPLIDLGVHMIDLAIWLMGNPRPIAVSGAAYNKLAQAILPSTQSDGGNGFSVEDLATGFIRFDNGATLQIEFSWASNIEEEHRFLELRGTSAGCSMRDGELKLFTEIEQVQCDIIPRFSSTNESMHSANIQHFVDCVLGKAEPIIKPEFGVDMIKILSAIYESTQKGMEIRL
ncbi:Gfo/Idh/MocA family protein [Paenibacillus sp. GCM10027626]|uniref:Gfo/Idh/MocA family protein n=1 Tax=Paenibacillus sp. GCM10027626 TaxID=3273411 RepID=UPI00363C866C